jgi:hypothetical protein
MQMSPKLTAMELARRFACRVTPRIALGIALASAAGLVGERAASAGLENPGNPGDPVSNAYNDGFNAGFNGGNPYGSSTTFEGVLGDYYDAMEAIGLSPDDIDAAQAAAFSEGVVDGIDAANANDSTDNNTNDNNTNDNNTNDDNLGCAICATCDSCGGCGCGCG